MNTTPLARPARAPGSVLCLPAAAFQGAAQVRHPVFENQVWPDPPDVLPVRRGGPVSVRFRAPAWRRTRPFLRLTLYGYPGTCLQSDFDRPYIDCASLFLDLRIRLSGKTIHEGPLFLRNHGHCGFGQKTDFQIPWNDGVWRSGRNELVLDNRTRPGVYPGADDYYLIATEIRPSTGRLIEHPYQPDALDGWLDTQPPADDLKCGVGYELVPNRQVPAMIAAIADDRVGNYLVLRLDTALNDGCRATPDELVAWARLCAERRLYFSVMLFRARDTAFTPETARRMKAVAGRYFFSVNHHELGLAAFGRKAWIEPFLTDPIRDLQEGWALYRRVVRTRTERELPAVGLPVVASESYLASGHNLLSGIDITVAEVYATGTVTLMNGARGATRMLGRRRWGVHMPLLWSLGVPPLYPADAARVRRQALAVRLAYLYGARILYPESGLLSHVPAYVVGSSASWQRACFKDPDDPIQRALRQTFRDVHRYHALHRIPDDPRTPFAFMQGQYDSFGGSIRRDLAFHTPGLAPPHADSGWDLLEVFHPEIRIGNSPRAPMRPWFAGAPRGQMDIVPPESPAARLSRYRLLAIPGWNTMTASLYGRLKAFAAGGGTLFLAAPQLRTDRKQVPLPTLFRNGRVGDLFGVTLRGVGGEIQEGRGSRALTGMDTPYRFYETNARNLPRGIESPHQFPPRAWRVAIEDPATQVLVRESRSGEPLLIRRRVGRGWAYLLTTWDYPGHPMLLPFVKHLLGFLADRQPQPLRAEGSPDLHVFDYPGSGGRRVALLDTDWQVGASPRTVVIRTGRTAMAWEVEPVRIRLIEERHGVWVSPRDESCAASLSGTPARGMTLRLVGFGRHTVELAHPGRVLRLPAEPGWIRERTGDGKTRLTLDLAGPMTIPLAFGPDRKKRS